MGPLEPALEALESATTLEDLQGVALGLRDRLDVDHVVYHWVSAQGAHYGFGTYDPAWAGRYEARDYIRTDPVVLGCLQHFHPLDWRRLDWSSRAARAFRADALDHGVGNQGYSVPIRGPHGQFALFSVSHTCGDGDWDAFIEGHRRELILLAHFLNEKALELESDRMPAATAALSPREIETMTLLGMGYSRAQTADTLSISEHTLRAYIESARFKLGALNTTHAVARAVDRGLIVIGGAARTAQGHWPGRTAAE